MKKSILAFAVTAFASALILPLFSGCSADVGYVLKTAEDGAKYYSARATGQVAMLRGELEIPEYYGEGDERYPVKEIEEQGFAAAGITKLTIPATVEKIGTAAFGYCNSLTEVQFAADTHISEIGWGAFGYCEGLTSFTVPDSVTTIGGMAFYKCIRLKEISLPAGLEYINRRAFESCENLDGVVLPDGLKSIGFMAFYNCHDLSSVTLPDSMTDEVVPVKDENGNQKTDESGNPMTELECALGYAAFHTCTSLKTVTVGKGITVIQSGVFGYCTALEEIHLPAGLKEVQGPYLRDDGSVYYGHPFHNCTSLKKVYFDGDETGWNQIKIDDTVRKVDQLVYDNSALLSAEKIFK